MTVSIKEENKTKKRRKNVYFEYKNATRITQLFQINLDTMCVYKAER